MGTENLGGVYLLRMRAETAVSVRFGRFRGGTAVPVPAGDYLYVGSALRGLARRLLRHAGRADPFRPHAIRPHLVEALLAAGLLPPGPQAPVSKRLHWHVDYLLEETAVSLAQIIALRTTTPLESPLARELMADPHTEPLVPGLGASDDPGHTHLLRVAAEPAWWQALPRRMSALLDEMGKTAHN